MTYEELYPEAKTSDRIQEHSLVVGSKSKPCAVCGKPTRFVEWCSESPLCGPRCQETYFDRIQEAS